MAASAPGHTIGTAWVQVALSTKAISQQLKESLGDVDTKPAERKITSGLGGAFKQVGKIAAGALAVAGTVGLATGFADVANQAISASDATNKFKNTLSFAGKSSDDINRLTKSTKDYADKTVYGLSDIQNITAQLASNNVEGYDKLAEAAGNLNAVAGGNAETFKSVGMVLTQTAGQGKLTTENWNQLADAIPGASGKLQEALLKAGAYTGNFREAMEKGEITAEEFNAAVMDLGMTDVAREAATSTQTIEGAWGNLEAALVSGGMSIVDKIKPALTSIMGTVATGAEKAFSWINDTLIPGIQGVWDILSKGQFDGSSKLFGLDEDSGIVDFLFKVGENARAAGAWITGTLLPSLRAIGEVLLTGQTDKPIFGLDPDSPVTGFLVGLRDAVLKVVEAGIGLLDWATRNKDLISTLAVTVGTATIAFKAMQAATKTMTAINAAGSIMKWVTSLDMMKNAVNAAKAAQAAFNVVMNANPIMLVVTAIAALVAGLVWFFTQTETGKRAWAAITDAFKGFLDWIAPYWNATLDALSAAWNAIWGAVSGFFTSYVVPTISVAVSVLGRLWDGLVAVVSAVWNGIKAAVQTVVSWFQAYVQPTISAVWDAIKSGADTLWNGLKTVWNGIKNTIDTVANWFRDTIKPIFDTVTDNIKTAFDNMKTGIKNVWDDVKSVAAKPINFIIKTVYRDGIKKTADSIAEKLGLSLRLPDVSPIPGYASGGVLPGYTPGRDVYHFFSPDGGGAIALSGGEAIMRPEWVRAVGGPAAINRMNAAARGSSGGHIPGGDRGANFAAFFLGGIWEKVKSTVGSGVEAVGDWIATAADAASSIISDPLGAVENLIRIPVNALMNSLPGSGFFKDMAAALPDKWIDGFGEWLKGNTASMSASDIVNAARMAIGVPYIWGGSSIPPGVDCSGLVYWAAHQMGSQIPRLTAAGYQAGATPGGSINTPGTLLFWGSPAYHIAIASGNGMMVEAPRPGLSVRETAIWGSPTTGVYKFDRGGLLRPGLTQVLNATGRPERVLTEMQWKRLTSRPADLAPGTPVTMTLVDAAGSLLATMRGVVDRATGGASRTAVREMMGVR